MAPALTISATELARSSEDRAKRQKQLTRELDEMSVVMVREEGLLNHSQAALLLDITPARVTELVNLGKLVRYDFLGRTYVSVKQVRERREQDLKAGRPVRGVVQRVAMGIKAALQTDAVQAKLAAKGLRILLGFEKVPFSFTALANLGGKVHQPRRFGEGGALWGEGDALGHSALYCPYCP
jgi:hypothetical protein